MDARYEDPAYGKRWWDQHATDVDCALAHALAAAALLWTVAR